MAYRAVLFDLDGTLLNTLEDLADSMNAVLKRFGFPEHREKAYKYFVGDGMETLVKRALPENRRTDESVVAECLGSMRREYEKRQMEKTRPYEGIPALLDAMAAMGKRMAILSNKPHDSTRAVVAKLLPGWSFDVVLGERPNIPKKPDPAGALEIASHMGIPCREFLYAGDTGTDMITANEAGMFAVGVLWGFRKAEELVSHGARALVEKPHELLTFF
jgi:phosphoglycolate phosphatase